MPACAIAARYLLKLPLSFTEDTDSGSPLFSSSTLPWAAVDPLRRVFSHP